MRRLTITILGVFLLYFPFGSGCAAVSDVLETAIAEDARTPNERLADEIIEDAELPQMIEADGATVEDVRQEGTTKLSTMTRLALLERREAKKNATTTRSNADEVGLDWLEILLWGIGIATGGAVGVKTLKRPARFMIGAVAGILKRKKTPRSNADEVPPQE